MCSGGGICTKKWRGAKHNLKGSQVVRSRQFRGTAGEVVRLAGDAVVGLVQRFSFSIWRVRVWADEQALQPWCRSFSRRDLPSSGEQETVEGTSSRPFCRSPALRPEIPHKFVRGYDPRLRPPSRVPFSTVLEYGKREQCPFSCNHIVFKCVSFTRRKSLTSVWMCFAEKVIS